MKRLQVNIEDETFEHIKEAVTKCNDGFQDGSVKPQDVVNWMLSNSSYDVQKIRSRCFSLSKIIKNARFTCKEDVDEFQKKLNQFKPLMKSKDDK